MQSPDHPDLVFVQAKHYGAGRPDGPPRWIIAHTMEASETSTRAENTAGYFANPGDGRVVSAHYCADSNSVVQCVRLADTAFTVGNTQGNRRGINWEFSGFAAQSGAQWGDTFSMAMLAQAAPYWALDAARYGIPIRRVTVAELRAGTPGLSTHNDFRLAFGGTTHTDPGANFPWSAFIDMIEGASVTYEQFAEYLTRYMATYLPESGSTSPTQRRVRGLWRALITGSKDLDPIDERVARLETAVAGLDTKLNTIIAALAAGGSGGLVQHTHGVSQTFPAVSVQTGPAETDDALDD